jgi:fatty acid desaturase
MAMGTGIIITAMGGIQGSETVRPLWRRIELPTWAVAAAIYGGWGMATWWHAWLPWWLMAPIGGYLVAWHGSLQHEIIHSHPTQIRWLATLLALPPLSLWIPYPLYRESHLAHHRDRHLTCPINDPESYYVLASDWARKGSAEQALLRILNTFAGRLALGPVVVVLRFWWTELKAIVAGDRRRLAVWSVHLALAAALLFWVVIATGMSVAEYIAFFAYPGLMLTLLRSFNEHRADPVIAHRSALVETGPVLALMFLNNNLHALHHDDPARPWYELPRLYRERRPALIEANGGFVFRGYGELARRYIFTLRDTPQHPTAASSAEPVYAAPDLRRAT